MANKKSFLVYFDWEEPLQTLQKEELGELFLNMLHYAKTGEELEFESFSAKVVFCFIKSAIDRDKEAYEERCRKNAENGSKGGKKTAENHKNESDRSLDFSSLVGTTRPI